MTGLSKMQLENWFTNNRKVKEKNVRNHLIFLFLRPHISN